MFWRRSTPNSIGDRLVRSFMLVAAVVTTATAAGLFAEIWFLARAQMYTQLVADAGRLALMVSHDTSDYVFDYKSRTLDGNYSANSSASFFQILKPDGTVLARSPSLGDARLIDPKDIDPAKPPGTEDGQVLEFGDLMLPSGRAGTQCWIRWNPMRGPGPIDESKPNQRLTVIVATDPESTHSTIIVAAGVLTMGVVVAMFVLWCIARLIVRRGLASLISLSEGVAELDETRFSERFNPATLPRETAPLAAAINTLLSRAESALEHERRFAASAAHELRTPIAEIRSVADVARRIGSVEAMSNAASEISLVAGQMENVLAALLRLSKRRMELHAESFTDVQIAAVVDQALRRHRTKLASRNVEVRTIVRDDLSVRTDDASLTTIIGNLIDNAAEYTPDGGFVSIMARADHSRLELEFANGPVSLADAELARIFDPFWRKDSARARGDHSGLGLAIVRAMCESLDGRVWAQLTDGTLRILVTLPIVAEDIHRGVS